MSNAAHSNPMKNSSNTISINLGLYESQIRGEIASDLATLHVAHEAMSHPDYINTTFTLKQGIVISQINVPPIKFQKKREVNKCFKSVMSSMQDYLDKMISILRLKSDVFEIVPPVNGEVINRILTERFKKHLMEVSTDRSLNVPKKLNLIFEMPEHQVYKEALQSYFDVRNAFEHHKGIAKVDRVILYKRLGLASTAGYEVKEPGPLGENEGLVLKTFDEKISFDGGGEMLITKEQLEVIILGILIFIIPTVQIAVGEKLNI